MNIREKSPRNFLTHSETVRTLMCTRPLRTFSYRPLAQSKMRMLGNRNELSCIPGRCVQATRNRLLSMRNDESPWRFRAAHARKSYEL